MSASAPLSVRPGYALKQVDAAFRTCMDRELRPIGLSAPQYAALEVVAEHPGASVAELARRTFVSRQSAHQLLDGLLRAGLVERNDGPGRALRLHLTDAGTAALRSGRERVLAIETAMVAPLAAHERELLLALLQRCRSGLADVAEP